MSSSIMFGLLALAIIIPLYNVSGTEDTEAATSYNEASITLTSSSTTATITADAATLGSSGTTFISSNLSTASQYASYSITTTNATGYTIGIATNTSSTSTNLTSGTNTLSSLAYNNTTKNGLSSSSYNTATYNNTWALYPGTVGNSANSKFYPISNNTITMGTTTAANSTVTSSNTYKVGLAARITMNQASGTYTTTAGNFKVTAVGNAAAYTITYNANGGSGAPTTQSSTSYSQQSVTLSSTTPTKTGYDFLGWCTKQTSDQTTQSNGSTACTNAGGTYYAKGGTFYIDETTTNITTLYAIWYLKDITVTGVFGGSGVTGITFANQTYGDKSITTNNGTTTLKYGASYTISGTYSDNYKFSSWATSADGVLENAASESTTYTVTANSTLTLTGEVATVPLYDTIASMSKGDFDMSTISTSLTTANSGVYKYTGSHSDDGTSDIYFYRGIIDSSFTNSSTGSSGDGTLYPNYVKLTTKVGGTTYNTCWRIFRTTASGGVKMIYNGLWTGSTCANATTSAQLSSATYYNRGNPSTEGLNYYDTKGFIAYAGYNYNNTYAYNNTSYTSAIENDALFTNSTASNIRTTVENWYTSTLGTATNSLLEPSAGYCNDRSTYDISNTETTTTIPYGPSTQTNFGARDRNYVKTSPSLACPYPSRDLLTTSNGLGYPVALITMDEVVLAGNGYDGKEAYAKTSYLTSGWNFWSLSPYARYFSKGDVNVASVFSSGYVNYSYASVTYGVRPVISLKFGTTPESGSGTATDPWVVMPPPPTLYDTIASMSKGKQTNNTNTTTGIQAKITAPTSTDRTQDTSNSGVFEYDASLFGESSDASNDYKIYYYRGILEPEADQGSYGSDGKATTYPNYVKLSNNTCWRILRTTGSGGVKLIYNGTYGATTSGSCANATTKAQVINSAFNSSSASNGYTSLGYHDIHAVGYTYNNSVTSSTTATAASTVFGSNSNYSVNSSPSIMKQYLENTWYKNNMEAYTSKLESSAGYCNDRSLYASGSYATALSESTAIVPYGTSGMTLYYFGPYTRNSNSAQKPSLTCPRNVVDLYTTSSASNGNKQLGYPVALATADEMSFAGSGDYTASNGSSYNAKSFARSGSDFWLLSPYRRDSDGNAFGCLLNSGGYLYYFGVYYAFGVRPVISLKFGTTPASGSGTATDPWVVQ